MLWDRCSGTYSYTQKLFFSIILKKFFWIFAGNDIKNDTVIYLIAGKAFNQLDSRILWLLIPPNEMTVSDWFLQTHRRAEKWKKYSIKFFIGCGQTCPRLHAIGWGAQRLLKSSSLAGGSIEWEMKWKERSFHAFLIHNLSLQVLLSNQIVASLSLHVGRCTDEESVKEKWDSWSSWSWCKMNEK